MYEDNRVQMNHTQLVLAKAIEETNANLKEANEIINDIMLKLTSALEPPTVQCQPQNTTCLQDVVASNANESIILRNRINDLNNLIFG